MDLHDIPGDQHCMVVHLPLAATGDATAITGVTKVPFRCTLSRVFVTFRAAVTGTDTQSRTLNIKDASGNILAGLTFLATPPTNAVAGTPLAIPVTGTAANLNLAADAGLQVESALVGTGLALPLGQIAIHVKGR